jgi:hypothetical protein
MKNKFLNISIGIAIMLFSAGFFVRSINTANAAPPMPQQFIEEGKNTIGKYQMSMAAVPDGGSKVVIINTETAETVYYAKDNGVDWVKVRFQIPTDPFAK